MDTLSDKLRTLGNLKIGTESLIIAEQINAIKSNYIKAKINKQEDRKCWLCGDRDYHKVKERESLINSWTLAER